MPAVVCVTCATCRTLSYATCPISCLHSLPTQSPVKRDRQLKDSTCPCCLLHNVLHNHLGNVPCKLQLPAPRAQCAPAVTCARCTEITCKTSQCANRPAIAYTVVQRARQSPVQLAQAFACTTCPHNHFFNQMKLGDLVLASLANTIFGQVYGQGPWRIHRAQQVLGSVWKWRAARTGSVGTS